MKYCTRKTKYRIRETIEPNGTKVFVPQYKCLTIWRTLDFMGGWGEEAISFDSLRECQEFLTKVHKGEIPSCTTVVYHDFP